MLSKIQPYVLLHIILFTTGNMIKKAEKDHAKLHERQDFIVVGTPHPDSIHEVIFAVKQRNLDQLESLLYEVSDPDSLNYGKFWTRDEVADLTANPPATSIVCSYLRKNGVEVSSSVYGEYITGIAKISIFEEILDTKFHLFQHTHNELPTVIRTDHYSLHEEIHHHISTVFNVIDLPFPSFKFEFDNPLKNTLNNPFATIYPGHVYPGFLKNHYNIYGNAGTQGSQCIYASLKQSFSPKDLSQFQNQFNLPNSPISSVVNGYSNDTACSINSENCIEANLDVQYILAVSPNTPTTYWYDDSGNFAKWIKTISSLKQPPLVHSISYGVSESYSSVADIMSTFNTEAQKLGMQGVTLVAASGDDGAPSYTAAYSNIGCKYNPSFPASSPYVTAVGGTQGPESNAQEISCSSVTGGAITSGGGFSTLASAPSFQKRFVSNYFSQLLSKYAPASGYTPNGRAYPDVSILAYNYVVYIGGTPYSVSGTSASAPVFAGMVSLVNAGRLAAGKSALGWLNPSIYKMNGSFANDISSGNNKCTRSTSLCCQHGYYAAQGWDPVTGFGSVDYTKFCKAFYGGSACSSGNGASMNMFLIGCIVTIVFIFLG